MSRFVILKSSVIKNSGPPARESVFERRKGARDGCGDAEKEVGIWLPGEPVGEGHVAEQRGISLTIAEADARDRDAHSDTMFAVQPVDLVMELVDPVAEAGMTPFIADGYGRDTDAVEIDLGNTGDVGEIIDQADEAELGNKLRAVRGGWRGLSLK